jgi:hypothetical protein
MVLKTSSNSSKILFGLNTGSGGRIPTKSKVPTPKIEINLPPKDEKKNKAQEALSQTLNNRTSIFDTATPLSNTSKSARKVKKTVNGPSLYDRVFSTENIQIGSLVVGSAAVAAAFGTWALKVGALTASKIVVTNLIEFLQPGMTVVGFALKAGLYITLNAVVPVASALITLSLPIISTIVVTTISVLVILQVVNKMIQKLEEGVKAGYDKASEIPGKLLEQIPGYSTISSLFGYDKASTSEEKPIVETKQKPQSIVTKDEPTKNAPRYSETFLDDLDVEVKPRSSKRKPAIYTRQDFLRNKKVIGE